MNMRKLAESIREESATFDPATDYRGTCLDTGEVWLFRAHWALSSSPVWCAQEGEAWQPMNGQAATLSGQDAIEKEMGMTFERWEG